MQYVLVYTTAPTPESARHLAKMLVAERLAACANIIESIYSIYWWNDEIQNETESLCLLKTTKDRFAALEARIKELHPYEVPCIVALPIEAGFPPFLQWIAKETQLL